MSDLVTGAVREPSAEGAAQAAEDLDGARRIDASITRDQYVSITFTFTIPPSVLRSSDSQLVCHTNGPTMARYSTAPAPGRTIQVAAGELMARLSGDLAPYLSTLFGSLQIAAGALPVRSVRVHTLGRGDASERLRYFATPVPLQRLACLDETDEEYNYGEESDT